MIRFIKHQPENTAASEWSSEQPGAVTTVRAAWPTGTLQLTPTVGAPTSRDVIKTSVKPAKGPADIAREAVILRDVAVARR